MNKRMIAFLLLLGLSGLVLGTLMIRDQNFKSGFAQIAIGASQADVRRILGEPDAVVACAHSGGTPPAGCTKEFSYVTAVTFTDEWVLSLDANDRVIRKLRYRSP